MSLVAQGEERRGEEREENLKSHLPSSIFHLPSSIVCEPEVRNRTVPDKIR